uniref:DNA mismatch repair protein MutS core domain-containing protein n=1 Tax=Panagrolaimus sp. PS1159 TaxID=55785 RepID=A0AC35FN93_9BILA
MKRSKLKSPKTPSNQTSLLSFFNKSASSSSGIASKLLGKSPKQIRRNVNISLGKKRTVDVIDLEDDSPSTTNTQSKRPRTEDSDEGIEVIETPKQQEAPAPLTVNITPTHPLRHRMILNERNTEFGVGFSSETKKTPATPRTPTSSRKNIGSSVICKADVTPSTTQSLMATSSTHLTCTGVEKEAHELFCVDTEKGHKNKVDTTQNKNEKEKSSVGNTLWHHELLDFLQPVYIKDLKGHQPDHPEYNPKTLHIPENYFYQQTAKFKQWWDMKRYYFDTIIFFKEHTNYELFHMDALIGINVLGLPANKGDICHCTFLESFYGKYLEILLDRGYKVARVEQSETSEIDRIICRISTASTKTYGIYDVTDDKISLNSVGVSPSYLMALVELTIVGDTTSYGLCFIDTSIGKFIVYHVCSDTEAVLNTTLSAAKKEALIGKSEFYPPVEVNKQLMEPHFYGNELDKWPKELGNIFNLSVSPPGLLYDKELCVEALGGIMYYLNRCRIDIDMFSMGRLEYYVPPNIFKELRFRVQIPGVERWKQKNLALDDITLMNLHLIPTFSIKKVGAGVSNSSSTVSLFFTIDFCKTAFGKRLLRSWICAPSCDPTVIAERQDAVEYLMQQNGIIEQMDEYLTNLPDLEIFLQNFLWYTVVYINIFSPLIERCIGEKSIDIEEDLLHFEQTFDREKTIAKGYIVPRPGIDNDYDESLKKMHACEAACNDYVDKLKKEQNIPQIKLFGTGKNRYLLEISDMFTEKLGNEFELQSKDKGFNLYSTKELNELVSKLKVAECERNVKLKEAIRKIFKHFSSRKIKFIKVISQIAILDCLGSLAKYARECSSLGYPIARPVFDFESDTPFLEIEQGYHPLLISK